MTLLDITKDLFDYLVNFRRSVARAAFPSLDEVRHDLEAVFLKMDEKVSHSQKLVNEYRQVKYPLVVLADEIILSSGWSDAKRWEKCLLEKSFFSSNIGGNQFFKLLIDVDHMPTSVITVFFYCLALGFRGGFPQDDPSLLRLKGRLLHRILPSGKPEEKILPEAYTLDKSGTGRLPRLWKWGHLFIAALLVFVALLAVLRFVVWPLLMGPSMSDLAAIEAAPSSSLNDDNISDHPKGYTVQLGSFATEIVAVHFSQQIKQKGIESRIVIRTDSDNKHRYLVLTGAFTSEEEAIQTLNKAKSVSTLVSEMSILTLDKASGDCIYGCM